MTNDIAGATKAWREEVKQLLGISWDRFIEWTIIVWLSAWIWTAWTVSNAFIVPVSGPIAWISDVIREFGGTPAAWLVAIPEWLTDPVRASLLPISVVASAVFVTLSLRSYALTGLRVLALACASIAVEVDGSMWPLLWIVLIAAIPTAVAILAGVVSWRLDHEGTWGFYPSIVVEVFVVRVVGLFAMPVLAPIVLLAALVFAYQLQSEYRPADDLGRGSARALARDSQHGKTLASSDPLVVTSAIVAAITASSGSRDSRSVAASFDHALRGRREGPTGATGRIGRAA